MMGELQRLRIENSVLEEENQQLKSDCARWIARIKLLEEKIERIRKLLGCR